MDLIYFLGRLHVLVLHLPIGVILVAVVFDFFARQGRDPRLKPAGDFLWGGAALSAIATVVLGYMHLAEGGFDASSAAAHRLYGTTLAVLITALWVLRRYAYPIYRKTWAVTGLGVLFVVTMTGHYGGNLTHGATFLVEFAPGPLRFLAGAASQRPAGTSVSAAKAYPAVASSKVTADLLAAGFVARQVAPDDARLGVSIDAPRGELGAEQLNALLAAGESVVELALPRAGLRDQQLQGFERFAALTKLRLDRNAIGDDGVITLARLPKLRVLNLRGNLAITDASVAAFVGMRELRVLYVWDTGISSAAIRSLHEQRPELTIVGGLEDVLSAPGDTADSGKN